ncbi:MAG: carboxypeptidase regulatory-like domain-containing protein [Symploca sp. SIO1A3]|nr:carboxypeptidase regulatory-like domain-containing protein [Symploca sp. SIO1A3]
MKWKLLIPITIVSVFGCSLRANAHGVKIEYQATEAIEIQAQYDTGKPISNAQVTVYAPEQPSIPWLTGTTDTNGNFAFAPTPSKPGNWTVKVRRAGHGDIINIAVAEAEDNVATDLTREVRDDKPKSQGLMIQSTTQSLTPLQTILMGVSGVWGFIGTALFFRRG